MKYEFVANKINVLVFCQLTQMVIHSRERAKKMRLLSFVKQNLMNRYVALWCVQLKTREEQRMCCAVGLLSSNHFAVFSWCPLIFCLYDAFLLYTVIQVLFVCRLQHHLNSLECDQFCVRVVFFLRTCHRLLWCQMKMLTFKSRILTTFVRLKTWFIPLNKCMLISGYIK